MQLNWVYLCGSMPDDTTESVATLPTHSLRLQSLHPSIICMPQLQPCCSGTQINDPEVSDKGSYQPWDNDWASWPSVLPRTRASAIKYMSMENWICSQYFFRIVWIFIIFTDLYPAVLLGRKVLILMWITMPVKLDVWYQIILLNWHGFLQSNNYWS